MGHWGLAAVVPALLALLTAVGSWIALQQMLIARTKLNNDLFDRRFAIYWATRIYIRDMLRDQGATQEDAVKHWEIAAAAPFLFDRQLVDHIKEISDRGSKIRGIIGGKPLHETLEGVKEYNEHYMWFTRCFDDLENRFHDSLSLLKIQPFSIWKWLRKAS